MNNEEKILGMLETLTVDMSEVKDRLGNVEQSVSQIGKRLDFVEETLAETRKTVDKTHKSVVFIENDHGDTLKYLRDGYNNNTAKLTSIEKKVKRHEKLLVGNVS